MMVLFPYKRTTMYYYPQRLAAMSKLCSQEKTTPATSTNEY